MTPKPGIYTTEFWLTAAANISGAVMALLAGYGLIRQGESELWLALVEALALTIIPLALAYMNGRYIEGRSMVKYLSDYPGSNIWDHTLADELWRCDPGQTAVE